MFSQISWTEYVQFIFYVLLLYYGYVISVYYRKDIRAILSGDVTRPRPGFTNKNSGGNTVDKDDESLSAGGHYLLVVESLKNELTAFISQAGLNEVNKEGIFSSLQILIQKYSFLRESPYKKTIEQLITHECKMHCSVSFSDAEFEELWKW